MYPSVRSAFQTFSQRFEGVMATMYLDTHAPPLVTTGVGNLIDPVAEALALPFLWKKTDRAATPDEITAEWTHVKGLTSLAHCNSSVWDKVTNLYLPAAAIGLLVLGRLDQNEKMLNRRWPFAALTNWPADAQLGLFSMAWAMGPGFHFPLFEEAVRRRDFASAALQCGMNAAGNPGLVPRNVANTTLFRNAAQVERRGLNPSTLVYPQSL